MQAVLPAAYRKALIQTAPVLLAGLAVFQDTDLNSALTSAGMWWQVVVAVAAAALVWLPPSPWLKLGASLIAVLAGTVAAAVTDNLITGTEVIQIVVMIGSFVGVSAVPNASTEPVRPTRYDGVLSEVT